MQHTNVAEKTMLNLGFLWPKSTLRAKGKLTVKGMDELIAAAGAQVLGKTGVGVGFGWQRIG